MNASYSGYIVRYQDATISLKITVAEGVRGLNVPCTVYYEHPDAVYHVHCQGRKLTVLKVEEL